MTNAAGTSHVNREEPIDFTKEIASAAPAFMNEPEITQHHLHALKHSFDGGEIITYANPIEGILMNCCLN